MYGHIIVDSSGSVPMDHRVLMSRTLRELGADPAVLHARWVQSTRTRWVCTAGISASGDYIALLRRDEAPAPRYPSSRVSSQTTRPPATAASSSASATKVDNTDNASDMTSEQAEITRDLCLTDNAASASAAPAPTSLPSATDHTTDPAANPTDSSSPCFTAPQVEVKTVTSSHGNLAEETVPVAQSSSSRDLPSVNGPPPIPGTELGGHRHVSFLGRWRFPQGPDGKCRQWDDLQDDNPPLAMRGTPARSVLVEQGHTGQLQRAGPFDGVWKNFPLTPEQQARKDQRDQRERERKARYNAGGFGKRAAQFRERAAKLKAAVVQAATLMEPVSTPRRVEVPSREAFRTRVNLWKAGAEKLKQELLAKAGAEKLKQELLAKAAVPMEPVSTPRRVEVPSLEEFRTRVALWKVAAGKLKEELLARGACSDGACSGGASWREQEYRVHPLFGGLEEACLREESGASHSGCKLGSRWWQVGLSVHVGSPACLCYLDWMRSIELTWYSSPGPWTYDIGPSEIRLVRNPVSPPTG
ncbi:hypothetical protein L873DRAFT_1023468 [Choiromyces venosus 120613-1]|uniref:Uncharacterized protein n=1 Tax=Choiromyces venosus 120613-1 TaxID=1336337 RepID=A0A3N4IW85_9PEZI|nr:hypothetical protein L873DRAFT_1023468 [Choiromyces venosus 120613-1]